VTGGEEEVRFSRERESLRRTGQIARRTSREQDRKTGRAQSVTDPIGVGGSADATALFGASCANWPLKQDTTSNREECV